MTAASCGTLEATTATNARTAAKSGDYLDVDPDGDLVTRWKAGDERAFESLIRRHEGRVFGLLLRMLGNREDAEDVAQETFIKAYQALHRFRGESQFFTWLYRIAWRCFADHHRRRKSEQSSAAGQLPEVGYTTHERDQLHMDFARALMNFEPERRMVLHLHLQREFTHHEIARIMDRPLGTIKSHIQRGRPKLQQYMEAWQT